MSLEDSPVLPFASPISDDSRFPAVPSDTRWDALVSITVELFGVAPRIETMVDPEDPQETPFTVFTVCAAGEISELVDKRFQWHERVDRLQPQEHPRLSIVPTL